MTKQELEPLLDQLITLGEDADELNYWRDIFDDLPAEKQDEVGMLFKAELDELQAIEKEQDPPTPPVAPSADETPYITI